MNYQELEDIAQRVRAGNLGGPAAFAALNSWSTVDGVVAELVHFLHHYIADEDIRMRDKNYAAYQEIHFDELMKKLRDMIGVRQPP